MAELKNGNLSVATEGGLAQLSTKLFPNKNQEQTIAGKDTNITVFFSELSWGSAFLRLPPGWKSIIMSLK